MGTAFLILLTCCTWSSRDLLARDDPSRNRNRRCRLLLVVSICRCLTPASNAGQRHSSLCLFVEMVVMVSVALVVAFIVTTCICKAESRRMFSFSEGRHSFYEKSYVGRILRYSDAPFASCAQEDPARLSNARQQSACTHARQLHATV